MLKVSPLQAMLLCVGASILAPTSLRLGPISVFDGLLLCTMLLVFLRAATRGFPGRRLSYVSLVLLATLGLFVIGYVINLDAREQLEQRVRVLGMASELIYERVSVYGVITIVLLVGAYELASRLFQEAGAKLQLLTVIALAGALNAVVTIITWIVETGGVFARYNFTPPLDESPGVHAGKMGSCAVAALALFLIHEAPARQRWLGLVCFALVSASISTVLVRQGWAFFLLGMLLLISFGRKHFPILNWRKLAMASVVAVVLGGAVVVAYGEALQELLVRPGGFITLDLVIRAVLIKHAADVFLAHPWFGVGYGHFIGYSTVPIFPTEQLSSITYVASAHNGMMMVLAETGIVGTIAFIVLIWALVREIRRGRASARSVTEHALVAFVISQFVLALIGHFTSNSAFLPPPTERGYTQAAFVLWVGLGLVGGLARPQLAEQIPGAGFEAGPQGEPPA